MTCVDPPTFPKHREQRNVGVGLLRKQYANLPKSQAQKEFLFAV